MFTWLQTESGQCTNLGTSSGAKQTESGQCTNLQTSSVANLPRRSLKFWQVGTVVDSPSEAGSPSWLLASGVSEVSDFFLSLNVK